MARHLNYNPGRDSIEYLEAITCGENRLSILEQLVLSLKAEIGRPNHQHHLLIGPRGAGKTHLLRLLTGARIPDDPALAAAYLPVVMPEETPLRSPGDLFLKFVEKLAEILKEPPAGLTRNDAEAARGVCLTALTTAKGLRDPLERLDVMAAALESAARAMGRIILPVAENMDQTFYLGAQRSRKNPLDEQWALRRHLQDTPHLLLIAAAPSIFGAVGDPGKPFFDFFRTHELQSLSSDEVLEIIRLRLKHEASNPGPDGMRNERVQCLLDHFVRETPQLRGILAITGGLPRFTHLTYEVIIETDVNQVLDTLNGFLDNLTPYFQHRLDPRVIPQPEIDLLHALALARGPQQPTELADELYGVPANEVSELLGRLQERGLVKRAGRPGGQAVTWDLTEPLYRVWTQFRDNPEGQEEYRLLAEFVALFFSLDEVEKELEQIGCKLSSLPDDHCEQKSLSSRKRLLCYVKEYKVTPSPKASFEKEAVSVELSIPSIPSVQTKIQVLPPVVGDRMLATDLFNAFDDAREKGDKEKSQRLLDELRSLSRANPEDSPVREQLAMGLVNAIYDAGEEGDIEVSQSFLDELRELNHANPEDGPVREDLAMGLVNAHYDAGKKGNKDLSQNLLEELRRLSLANPDDGPIREHLADGLFNAFNYARKEGDKEQSRTLLEELRDLSRANSEEARVCETLAQSLFNALNYARKERDQGLSQSLLEELRSLSRANPNAGLVRESLARGLVNAIHDALKEGDKEVGQTLLEELRRLSRINPEDGPVLEQLAMGLFNAHYDAGKKGNKDLSQNLLEELRRLSLANPDDGPISEHLARGLFNAFNDAGKEGDNELSQSLLEELRKLNQANPEDAPVREPLSRGLFNAFNDARKEGDKELSRALIGELRGLSRAHPEDGPVRENLADGLFNAFHDARKEGDSEESQRLLEELIRLTDDDGGEPAEKAGQKGAMMYAKTMLIRLKEGNAAEAKEGMRWLEARMPTRLASLLRPAILAMEVLEKGEEQALAREPEEVRRVVRTLLENLD